MICLALDAGGVLVDEPIPNLLRSIAASSSHVSYEELREKYDEIYESLWTGALSPDEALRALCRYAQLPETESGLWVASLRRSFGLREGIATALRSWRERVDTLVIVSNHRSDWLLPSLRKGGVDHLFDAIYISAAMGIAKPDPRFFGPLLRTLSGDSRCLVCDDTQSNLDAAGELGMETLLIGADEPISTWSKVVDDWIREASR